MRIGAVAAHFGRDVPRTLTKISGMIGHAHAEGLSLLVLPGAALGGYIPNLHRPEVDDLPPVLTRDGAEFALIGELARDLCVCVGYCEIEAGVRYNSAVCLNGDGILGHHRKVHQPDGEFLAYRAGDRFDAFDTPVGRLGMIIDYDKTFPESTRTLAADGAVIIAALSAWPASITDRSSRLAHDRQTRLFDLYDAARAAENQVVLVSSNQTGVLGGLRFLGRAKVVGPGGDVLAATEAKGALAVADLDVEVEVARARRTLHHLSERRPAAYWLAPQLADRMVVS